MNRNDLIADIAARTGKTKKDVSDVVAAYEDSIMAAVSRGDSVSLHKFMKIERKMKNRHCVNLYICNRHHIQITLFNFILVTCMGVEPMLPP